MAGLAASMGASGRLYADDVSKPQRQQLLYERAVAGPYIEGARPARHRGQMGFKQACGRLRRLSRDSTPLSNDASL